MAVCHGQARTLTLLQDGEVLRFRRSDIEAFLEDCRVERSNDNEYLLITYQ